MTYVALSRVKKFKNILIKPVPFERLRSIGNCVGMHHRMEEDARLNVLKLKTRKKYDFLFKNVSN